MRRAAEEYARTAKAALDETKDAIAMRRIAMQGIGAAMLACGGAIHGPQGR